LGRGEAKRQKFALWLSESISPEDIECFNACIQDPPVLYSKTWFTQTQALETGPGYEDAKTEQFQKVLDDGNIGILRGLMATAAALIFHCSAGLNQAIASGYDILTQPAGTAEM
jgi:hypothetical protein